MPRILISLILSLLYLPVFSQTTFLFIPEVQGRNVDGLLNARILSPVQKRNVTLTITVSERKAGRVLTIKTPAFSLNPGNNVIPATAVRPAKIQFSNNRMASQIQQNGVFPEGDYEYCYTLSPEQGNYDPEVPAEQCFDAEVAPFSPLNLTEPDDKSKSCERRPMFSWQPSFPSVPGATYHLMLTEIKSGQNAVEAVNYNLPTVSQQGIVSPVLVYPNTYRELEPGKKYAWQVSLYKNQTVLNRSEVWEFTVDCKDSVERTPDNDIGYRDIEDLLKGNYYVADKVLKFSLVNSYVEQDLRYEIQCLTDPSIKIKKLPVIKLDRGVNKITIDLTGKRAFKDNHYYLLKVWLPNGSSKSLRFLYTDI